LVRSTSPAEIGGMLDGCSKRLLKRLGEWDVQSYLALLIIIIASKTDNSRTDSPYARRCERRLLRMARGRDKRCDLDVLSIITGEVNDSR